MAEPEEGDKGSKIHPEANGNGPGSENGFFQHKPELSTPKTKHPSPLDLINAHNTHYDSIIIGLGPVGLTCAIAAIERGERVALVTDRDLHKDLGVRQQILGVDEVMDWVSQLIRPDLLARYQEINRLRRTMYQPAEGPAYPYWYFSIGALEELLVEELDARIEDQLKAQIQLDHTLDPTTARKRIAIDVIKVGKIPAELSNKIDLSSSYPDQSKQEAMHQYIELSDSDKKLMLGNIEEINGRKVPLDEKKQSFYFHDLLAANGTKQNAEKALADKLSGANVHLIQPCYQSHVATVFAIQGHTRFSQGEKSLMPEKLTSASIDQMLGYCKINKKSSRPVSMKTLQNYGWELSSRPHQQVYTTGADNLDKTDLLYIGCEYPEALKPERLKQALAQALAARNKSPDSLEMKQYLKLPEAIRHALDKQENSQLSAFTDRDYAELSNRLARQWSRLLLADALPAEVCSDNNICDPHYGPDERAKAMLSTSRFDLKFFELGQSLSLLGDKEKGWGSFISLGDGRMFPLYTTGTGAQTGLKLARIFHLAKEKFNAELQKLYASQTQEDDYQDKIEQLAEQVYSEYHALSRAEIDNIRALQEEWVETRNQRQDKAEGIAEIVHDAQKIQFKLDNIMAACKNVSNICGQNNHQQERFNKPSLASQLQSYLQEIEMNMDDKKQLAEAMNAIHHLSQAARDNLHHVYTQFDCDKISCYEAIPSYVMEEDCDPQNYCQPLNKVCVELDEIKHLLENCSSLLTKPYPEKLEHLFQSICDTHHAFKQLLEFDGFKKYLPEEGNQGHALKQFIAA